MRHIYTRRAVGKVAGLTFFAMAACAFSYACGGDDNSNPSTPIDAGRPDTGSPDTGGGTSGTVAFKLTYSGTVISGSVPLLSTLWSTPQPGGPGQIPAGVGSNRTASWPGSNTVTIPNVAPGSYYAFAYIMVGADHEMGPLPGDGITPAGTPVTV